MIEDTASVWPADTKDRFPSDSRVTGRFGGHGIRIVPCENCKGETLALLLLWQMCDIRKMIANCVVAFTRASFNYFSQLLE
jgi:hypothetical protein